LRSVLVCCGLPHSRSISPSHPQNNCSHRCGEWPRHCRESVHG